MITHAAEREAQLSGKAAVSRVRKNRGALQPVADALVVRDGDCFTVFPKACQPTSIDLDDLKELYVQIGKILNASDLGRNFNGRVRPKMPKRRGSER
jgi:uncharacterized heparinase superfamily protein